MSQVSLSQMDYSAIGFSKTMTEEFDDLKKGQEALTTRVDRIKQWYTTLKKEEAKLKSAGENSEEEGEDALHVYTNESILHAQT